MIKLILIKWINFQNITSRPPFADINCLPKNMFEYQIGRLEEVFDKNKWNFVHFGPLLKQTWKPRFENDKIGKELFFKELDRMNSHRGFDLCDHIIELKIWRDSP